MYDPRAQCNSQYLGKQSLDVGVTRGCGIAHWSGYVPSALCRSPVTGDVVWLVGIVRIAWQRVPPPPSYSLGAELTPVPRARQGIGIAVLLPVSPSWH